MYDSSLISNTKQEKLSLYSKGVLLRGEKNENDGRKSGCS